MTTWIGDVPSPSADSNTFTRTAVDEKHRVHVAFASRIETGDMDTLTYAIGTPNGPIQIFSHQPFIAAAQYTWEFFAVVNSDQWQLTFLFDLALDSQGRAHVCFQGTNVEDHANTGAIFHAVFDEASKTFSIGLVTDFITVRGLSLAIAKDDSLHIAFADDRGLHHATRATAADPFVVTDVHAQNGHHSDVSIAIGSGGQMGISCFFQAVVNNNPGPLQLFYAQKSANGWTSDTADPGPLSGSNWPVATFFTPGCNSLAIDANGVPHIAYFNGGMSPASQSPAFALALRHATWSPAGQFFWVVSAFANGELVDSAAQPTQATILINANNAVSIAYQAKNAAGSTELRFASRATAGTWSTQTVDPSPNCGFGTSAALDPKSGTAHVAYGFTPIVNGWIVLKHAYGVNAPTLIPIRKTPKRPILTRPGM